MCNIRNDNFVAVRWMIRRDMPAVQEIDKASFGMESWGEDDFIQRLRVRNCIGMVAEKNGDVIVGHIVYELTKDSMNILRLAIALEHRREGIARFMIERLKAKITTTLHREEIRVLLPESNLGAQLFFKACGFRAVDVLRGHFEGTGEDAYQMRFRVVEEKAAAKMQANRISEY